MTRKKITSAVSASVLMFATMVPTAQAGGGDVFGDGAAQAEPLAAQEMDATEGRIVCGGACAVGALFVGSATLGYLIGSDVAN